MLGRAGRDLASGPDAVGKLRSNRPSRSWVRNPRALEAACAKCSASFPFPLELFLRKALFMTERTAIHRLPSGNTQLHAFIEEKVPPGTGVSSETFWKGFDAIVGDLAPRTSPCWPNATACKARSTPGTRPILPITAGDPSKP